MVRYERTPNHGVTGLNGSINDSVTSVAVSDGSVFPSEGDFRVIVDSEVMLVTARSSNTLTVVRGVDGTTAASHTDTAAIKTVATADQWDSLLIDLGPSPSDQNSGTAFTGLELPRLILDEDSTILTASDFTEIGFQTSTTLTDTSYGGLRLFDTNGGGSAVDNRLAVVPAPASTPWQVTVRFFIGYGAVYNSWDWAAVVARESGTGEYYSWLMRPWNASNIEHHNSTTSVASVLNSDRTPAAIYEWYRIIDNGTNILFQHSTNGRNFHEQYSTARTAHLAAGIDQVGFGINAETSGGNDWAMYVTSFVMENL